MRTFVFILLFGIWIEAFARTEQEVKIELSQIEQVDEPQEGAAPRPLIFRFGEHQRAFEWERTHPPPSCSRMEGEAFKLCTLIRRAQHIAEETPLRMYESKNMRREVALVSYNFKEEKFHTVMLDMPFGKPWGHDLKLKSSGYEVIRQRGLTLNQMTFDVRAGEEKLLVLAAKHLVVPVGSPSTSYLKLRFVVQPTVYLATHDELNIPEFGRAGIAYAREHLKEALSALRDKKVPSRAYPGKLVADVVSVDLLMRLIAIEQADPGRMFGEKYERLLIDNGDTITRAVFVRFVLNGLSAYHYICSNMKACGTFQFTNHLGKVGTYDVVRERYPLAKLDPQYVRGALSFINGAEAAACLIDLELANHNLPPFVRQLYATNPTFGGLFPIAAYNGGASQSVALAKLFERYKKEFGKEITLANIPWKWEPLAKSLYTKSGPLKQETAVYLRKYQVVEQYFREHR
jgi:hypothetical protein